MVDSVSSKHLTWLVENRSRNQKATLEILLLYRRHRKHIIYDFDDRLAGSFIVNASFSLWRAVFLSNVDFDKNDATRQVNDAESFLQNLVEHNSVTYSNDQQTKNFTFAYYVNNAKMYLTALFELQRPTVFNLNLPPMKGSNAYDAWVGLQKDLETAITTFDSYLRTKT